MDLAPIFKKLYPSGSIGPGSGDLQGECAVFAQSLVDIPQVGDWLWTKINAVKNYGILKENLGRFWIGDALVTKDSLLRGHVAVINNIVGNNLVLSESNFKAKKRVSHDRIIPKDYSKIIGVIRGSFKFNLPVPDPLTIKVAIKINQKPWKNLGQKCRSLKDWFFRASAGRLNLDICPLFTNFQNWYYKSYAASMPGLDGNRYYEVIDERYFNEQIIPIATQPVNFTLAVIYNHQWHGSVFNATGAGEYGWFYPASNKGLIICDENDLSKFTYGVPAFEDYAGHEILHWIYSISRDRNEDLTHSKRAEDCFADFDYQKLMANLC